MAVPGPASSSCPDLLVCWKLTQTGTRNAGDRVLVPRKRNILNRSS